MKLFFWTKALGTLHSAVPEAVIAMLPPVASSKLLYMHCFEASAYTRCTDGAQVVNNPVFEI